MGICKFLTPKQIFIQVLLLGCITSHGYGQNLTISLQDTTVDAVFKEIRRQTDIDFLFNHEEMAKLPRVSIHVKEAPIKDVLDTCFDGTGLTYKRINQTIIITPLDENQLPEYKRRRAQTLRGQVIDADSRSPLPDATIVIMNPVIQHGTITNSEGRFRFERLPVGRYILQVSYVGYQDVIVSELHVGSAKETVLEIPLQEQREKIEALTVSYRKGEALNQMASVSSRSFDVEEAKRYPVSISDPARMAQVFAGVTNTDDATNEIVIRGNSPNWLLWRLEGVEIPSPNHFAEEGYSAGAVSILSTNLIGRSDFFTGAFPAEYGNALSGVFDIRLRNGNDQHREYSFQAGLLGIDISTEGPFKEGYRGSFLFNYRYSTFSMLDAFNIKISQNALPNYQDLSYKVNLPTKKAGTFSFWGLAGLADDDERFEPDTSIGQDFTQGYSDNTKSAMYAIGVSHTWHPNDKSYMKTVLAHTLNSSSETYLTMDSLGVSKLYFMDDLQNKAFRFSTLYNKKISSKLTIRSGFTLSYLYYRFLSQNNTGFFFSDSYLDSEGQTHLAQAYVQAKYSPQERLLFNGGIHIVRFGLSASHSLEPRLGMQYKLNGKQKLSFGYGLHSRNENLPVYFVEIKRPKGGTFKPNQNLELTKAHHLIVGYEKMLKSDIHLKTELYYQHIYNLPVPNNPSKYMAPLFGGVNPGDTLVNIGQGRNYGIELTVQKFFTPDYYFLYSSSLFDAEYMPADKKWHDTKYNLGFIHNLVGGKEFNIGSDKLLGLNLRFIWAGGKRYFPIDLEASKVAGIGILDMSEPWSVKGKNYFRVDLGVRFHIYKESAEHIFSIDIQNLTNRFNVMIEDYDPVSQSIIEYPMTSLIPIFNYRLEF